MKLVMTLMVRDEADIIRPMLDYHLDQGVDTIIVTDNGSVDGTREILEEFALSGRIDLRHDPIHRKQQGESVTQMARDAFTIHGADWVINADADEFWITTDPSLTLASAFAQIPRDLQSFIVPVVDMTGPPALSGSGLTRLVFQDHRPAESLPAIGLLAHATHDTPHIGTADVTVSQGNHFVSLPSLGNPDPAFGIEVRHFPWRSWEQFRRKVENAGRAYESQTQLTPSPNHHGMRDYRMLQDGSLFGSYILRHPSAEMIAAGIESGELVRDTRIADLIDSPGEDILLDPSQEIEQRAHAALLQQERLEKQRISQELTAALADLEQATSRANALEARASTLEGQLRESQDSAEIMQQELAAYRGRRLVRLVDSLAARTRRQRD